MGNQSGGKGLAIAGLVLGIVGIVLGFFGGWMSVVALPVSIVGLVVSVIGGKKMKAANEPSGMATAGLVLGIIAVVISAILFFTCGLCTICVAAGSSAVNSATKDAADALEDALKDLR